MKILSQKQAKEKSLKVGIKLIGRYINSHTKTMFQCPLCQKEFLTRPNDIYGNRIQSCGCSRGSQMNTTSNNSTVQSFFGYIGPCDIVGFEYKWKILK